MSAFDELNAPELVRKWRSVVNDNVTMGRDSHLLKDLLLRYSPIQVLLGMYQYEGNRTVTISQFVRNVDSWIEEDDFVARITLAMKISHLTPPAYYVWMDNVEEEDAVSFKRAEEAAETLRVWSDRVLT